MEKHYPWLQEFDVSNDGIPSSDRNKDENVLDEITSEFQHRELIGTELGEELGAEIDSDPDHFHDENDQDEAEGYEKTEDEDYVRRSKKPSFTKLLPLNDEEDDDNDSDSDLEMLEFLDKSSVASPGRDEAEAESGEDFVPNYDDDSDEDTDENVVGNSNPSQNNSRSLPQEPLFPPTLDDAPFPIASPFSQPPPPPMRPDTAPNFLSQQINPFMSTNVPLPFFTQNWQPDPNPYSNQTTPDAVISTNIQQPSQVSSSTLSARLLSLASSTNQSKSPAQPSFAASAQRSTPNPVMSMSLPPPRTDIAMESDGVEDEVEDRTSDNGDNENLRINAPTSPKGSKDSSSTSNSTDGSNVTTSSSVKSCQSPDITQQSPVRTRHRKVSISADEDDDSQAVGVSVRRSSASTKKKVKFSNDLDKEDSQPQPVSTHSQSQPVQSKTRGRTPRGGKATPDLSTRRVTRALSATIRESSGETNTSFIFLRSRVASAPTKTRGRGRGRGRTLRK